MAVSNVFVFARLTEFNKSYFYTAVHAYMVGVCVFLCVVSVPDILSAIIYDS